jgi:hypothetical protein
MALRLLESDIIHMDDNTYMSKQLTHFAIEAGHDDRSLLATQSASRCRSALIALSWNPSHQQSGVEIHFRPASALPRRCRETQPNISEMLMSWTWPR